MEQLPYIDEHRIRIDGSRAAVWAALLSVLRGQLGAVPVPLARAWALSPRDRRGDWSQTLEAGDAIPGFEVAEAVAGERLALRGHHRFSRYALVFELDPTGDGCTLRAQSWAAFPGSPAPPTGRWSSARAVTGWPCGDCCGRWLGRCQENRCLG